MADKNLHDIKIDELDKKKTPLKNILTLLALLFVILVISVVITKLILNTGESETIDSNYTSSIQTEEESGSNIASTGAAALVAGATGAIVATANSATESTKNSVNNTAENVKNTANSATESTTQDTKNDIDIKNALKEKNNSSSKTKVTLRDHEPVKTVKELNPSTSSTKKATVKSTTSAKSTSSKPVSYSNSHADKVIVKRNSSTDTSSSKHSIGSTVSKLSNGFYIKVGTFKNTTNVIKAIKKTGLNYKLVKTNSGLTRAYIGRFSSRSSAKANLSKAKTVNPSAFIYEEK